MMQVAATLEDPLATPYASDDVDGVQWVEVQHMRKVQSEQAGLAATSSSSAMHALPCWS